MFLKPELVTKRLFKTHTKRADAVCNDWAFWSNRENKSSWYNNERQTYYKRIPGTSHIKKYHVNKDHIISKKMFSERKY